MEIDSRSRPVLCVKVSITLLLAALSTGAAQAQLATSQGCSDARARLEQLEASLDATQQGQGLSGLCALVGDIELLENQAAVACGVSGDPAYMAALQFSQQALRQTCDASQFKGAIKQAIGSLKTTVLAKSPAVVVAGPPKTPALNDVIFPGREWRLQFPNKTEVWTFDSQQEQMAFFNDSNGYNATISLKNDRKTLYGAYDSCTIDGTLGPHSAVLHTRNTEPECVTRFGASIDVSIQ